MLLCKQKALYVKCCIIANGITDSQGDTLYAEDIKKIFTSFNNQDNFEIYHDELPLTEVSLLENYISTADETLGTTVIPSGSWNAVIRVDNPDIQQGLLTGEFGGVSLNNRIAPRCKGNLKGTVRYQDVADAECIIPLLISFVESGANGFGLLVMDYDAYIRKSKDVEFNEEKGGHVMDFKAFLDGLKSLIKEAEAPEEPAIEKEDETVKEEEEVETTETVEETDSEEVTTEEEVTEEPEETPEEEGDDATIEKADDEEKVTEEEEDVVIEKETSEEEAPEEEEAEKSDLEARIARLEEIIAKIAPEEETPKEEETEDAEEPVDEDTPKITKSEKVIVETNPVVEHKNYFEMTGRDPRTGKKLR